MTNIIINFFTPTGFGNLLFWLLILVLVVYDVFAFLVIKQVNLMTHSFKTQASGIFTFIAKAHFVAALGLTILAIFLA